MKDTKTEIEEKLSELDNLKNERRIRRPMKRGAKIGMAVLAIAITAGVVAAVILFSHSLTFASTAKLTTSCSSLTGAAGSSTVLFTCSGAPAISVASGATGPVSYSAFTPVPPVADIFLVDAALTLGTSCSATTGVGNEPIPLPSGGASVTIGTAAGNLRPTHGYNYCMDFTALPASFTVSTTWSQ